MSCATCQSGECRDRERAAMCATCIRGATRGGRGWRGGRTVGCGHAGEPVTLYIRGVRACPWGKHPGRDGVTRWAFLRWHGVPMPLRLWLRLRAPTHPEPSSFAGCGCLLAPKSAWESIAPTIAAAARGRRRGTVTQGA